jgi:hypothetical protein
MFKNNSEKDNGEDNNGEDNNSPPGKKKDSPENNDKPKLDNR